MSDHTMAIDDPVWDGSREPCDRTGKITAINKFDETVMVTFPNTTRTGKVWTETVEFSFDDLENNWTEKFEGVYLLNGDSM